MYHAQDPPHLRACRPASSTVRQIQSGESVCRTTFCEECGEQHSAVHRVLAWLVTPCCVVTCMLCLLGMTAVHVAQHVQLKPCYAALVCTSYCIGSASHATVRHSCDGVYSTGARASTLLCPLQTKVSLWSCLCHGKTSARRRRYPNVE